MKRRLTGATRAIAYGEDGSTEISYTGSSAKYLNNAYNVGVDFSADEIDVTAFGDYPWKAKEPGFLDLSISLSLRHQVVNGELADDVEFMESHCYSRTPFRIAIIDDRTSTTPNGHIFSVVATKASSSGEFSGAQDHSYTLTRAESTLPPMRIVGGVTEAFV